LCTIVLSSYGNVWSSGFEEGDIYLITNRHVVKLDPVTGATTTLHVFPVAGTDHATYDPVRDMILTSIDYNGYYLWGVKADGTRVSVGPHGNTYFMPRTIAARGDGKIYFIDNFGLQYLDISGARHTLAGVDQAKIIQLQVNAHIVYDPGSNSIFLASPSGAQGSDFCSGLTGRTMVLKIPLNADGTAVNGAITCVERNVSPTSNDAPESIGLGPDGSIFVAVTTNTNNREPRLLTLDPFSMNTLSTFAASGPYHGAAALAAGVYSNRINKAVTVSWGGRPVRIFEAGEVGEGTVLSTIEVGTVAQLIEINGRCVDCPTCPTTLCSSVPNDFVWDRSVDWALGVDNPVNPALDHNGCPVWSYEWTTGDGLNSATPWYLNQTTQMVWDSSWFTSGNSFWVRGDNHGPLFSGGGVAHILRPDLWPYIPMLRWKNCTDGVEEICVEGELEVDWRGAGGAGSPVDVDVVIAHVAAADGAISLAFSTTVSKPSDNEEREFISIPISLQLAVELGDQLLITHRGRIPLTSRWITLRDNITITPCGEQIGWLAGRVAADCPEEGTGLFGVVVDLFEVGTGNLVASDTTDAVGQFMFCEIEAGDYTLSMVTPLGYILASGEIPVTVTGGATSNADFSLTCAEIDGEAKGSGFWKHEVGVATGGKGKAHLDAETLCGYLDLVEVHFNSNAINQVIIYEPPSSGLCEDKLLVAKDLLNLKGNVGMTARARQHLLSLLLNVAGGHIALMEFVSEDSVTVSQAITFCDHTLDDADGKNDELAKGIAEQINNGVLIGAGVIPRTIDNIAYSSRRDPKNGDASRRFGLDGAYPNPFNPQTTIAYAIPEPGIVTLKIYDVQGRLVRTIVYGEQPAGEHRAVWRGRDKNGSPVASGIYFVRLEFGSNMQIRKVVLLK
jgi:hypothetical protein